MRRMSCSPARAAFRHAPTPVLIEPLEPRTLLAANPIGLTPAAVRAAYGFDHVVFDTGAGKIVGDGAGQTIAIVNAFNAPTISSDLDVFSKAFSLDGTQSLYAAYGPATSYLTKYRMSGVTTVDPGWAQETALDVEWAHAIAPGAKIALVSARSDGVNDLLAAVNFARRLPNVVAVSMSWGTDEFKMQSRFDATFTTPASHPGVTFVAASGDDGAGASWPATSANVLTVGGTSLNVTAGGGRLGETAWDGSGGDSSAFTRAPAWQKTLTGDVWRNTPDVAYNADPQTGFAVYSSTADGKYVGWMQVGGTSGGAPQWAALVAIAAQGRALNGKASLAGNTQTLPALYSFSDDYFHDVSAGGNGVYSAGAGYDKVTGRGSPVADRIIAGLVALDGPAARKATVTQTLLASRTVDGGKPLMLATTAATTDTIGTPPPAQRATTFPTLAFVTPEEQAALAEAGTPLPLRHADAEAKATSPTPLAVRAGPWGQSRAHPQIVRV